METAVLSPLLIFNPKIMAKANVLNNMPICSSHKSMLMPMIE